MEVFSKYDTEKFLTLLIDAKSNIVKGYHYSDYALEDINVPNMVAVHLGKVDYDTYRLAVMCIDDFLDSFPVYDFDKKVLGLVRIDISGSNCFFNELTSKWSLNEGETVYKFNYFIDDPIDSIKHYENIYIKMQDKTPENAEINGKVKLKINLSERGSFTIKNNKGSEQTFKLKATLASEDSIWLVKYITVN
jgi:hypothetical protein